VFSCGNRLVNNVNVGQMTPEPDTGDDDVNTHITGLWEEYCSSPLLCDSTGRWDYETQADVAFRRIMFDGDILPVPDETGAVLHLEGHRCQAPTYGRVNRGVCGVETRGNRPYQYWLTKQNTGYGHVVKVADLEPVKAYNSEGWPNVFHCYHPRMFTLYRGVSALGACGAIGSRRDDLEFATVLKAQTANCVTFIESVDDIELYKMLLTSGTAEADNDDVGDVYFRTDSAGYQYGTADIHPGRVLRPKNGKKLTMETPNIPGDGQLELNLLLLQYLAMCWDLPLMSLMLDARMANFSSFRGIMDQARGAFAKHQRWFAACYHRPRFRNWLRIKAGSDGVLKRFLASERRGNQAMRLAESRLFRHVWNAPAWKYYHPVDDANGDLIQLANAMMTYDQYARKRHSMPGDRLRDQIIDFNLATYRKILEAKAALVAEFSDKVPNLVINENFLFSWPSLAATQMSLTSEPVNSGQSTAGGE